MKLHLIAVGTLRNPHTAALVADYAARLAHYMPFTLTALPDVRAGRDNPDHTRQRQAEAAAIMAAIAPADYVVLFDEHGRQLTSRGLSDFITACAARLPRNLVFVVGGPYGFDPSLHSRADFELSMSSMTLPHELARLMAVEQLYRAATIARGEKYHHD